MWWLCVGVVLGGYVRLGREVRLWWLGAWPTFADATDVPISSPPVPPP